MQKYTFTAFLYCEDLELIVGESEFTNNKVIISELLKKQARYIGTTAIKYK